MTSLRHCRLLMERAPRRASGFSLIELMVALTLGLLIVAAMLANLTASSASNRTNARVAEFQTNGRYATDFLRRELQHAGFTGLTRVTWSDPPEGTNLQALGATLTTDYGCGAGFAASLVPQTGEPKSGLIWGANDSNPFSGSCIPADNYARGDILVLRRAGPDPFPAGTALAANRLYFHSDYFIGKVFTGSTPPSGPAILAKDYLLNTSVYYISPWTNSATENPKVPALYRMTLGDGPAMSAQLVASGIENMQVQYGVRTTTGPTPETRYYDASAVPATLWTSVTSVRLWLLARSTTPDPSNVSTAAYPMGDQTYPDRSTTPTDGFQRQLFPLVVQIRK